MFRTVMILAGAAQLAIGISSLAIPHFLRWREETSRLQPLTRQLFWTYAGYTLGIHLAFGLLGVVAPLALLDGSTLAAAVTAFIALYWTVRVVLQFAVYDRSAADARPLFRVAEALHNVGVV